MSAAVALGDKKRCASGGNHEHHFREARTAKDGDSAGRSKYELRAVAQRLLPGHAVRRCQHRIAFGGEVVELWREGDKAWFEGAVYCNSVWTCPVCATRIAEERAQVAQAHIDAALSLGHGVAHATLTFSHHKGDLLVQTIALFSRALKRVKSGRAAVEFRERWGVIGEIRALEVTHGKENGWHPHSHAITVTRRPLSKAELAQYCAELFALWADACVKTGLGRPTEEHGVKVQGAKNAGDYVAKWGFATELTRSHLKRAKDGGRTPWQILNDAAAGDRRSRLLFREFADCFKGKRQLFYSHGLKKYLSVAPRQPKQAPLPLKERLYTFDNGAWDHVVAANAFELIISAAHVSKNYLDATIEGIRRCSHNLPPPRMPTAWCVAPIARTIGT